LLSKLKETLIKAFRETKNFLKSNLLKVNKVNLKIKCSNILKSIKKINIKDKSKVFIKNTVLISKKIRNFDIKAFIKNIKDTFIKIIGSKKAGEFLSSIDFAKINGISLCMCALILLASVISSDLDFGYSIICEGKVVAITRTKVEALSAYESSNESLDLMGISDKKDVKVGFVISNKENFQNYECAKNAISSVYDGRVDAYGIYADGVLVTALKTFDEANKILDDYKNEYTTEDTLDVAFNRNVEVISTRVPNSSVRAIEEALKEIKTPVGGLKTHIVSEGETISEIAEMRGTTVKKIFELNPDVTENNLQIGKKLNVSDTTPLIAVRTLETQKAVEKIAYETNSTKDASQYTGITIVVSDGIYGEKEVDYDIYKENGIVTEKIATSEIVLKEPVAKEVKVGTKKRPAYMATGTFLHPFRSGVITSRYGNRSRGFHEGLDLGGTTGAPIYAADGGTVSFAGWSDGYGKLVKINHGNGYVTYYAHLDSISVYNGQKVAKGGMIGRLGNTGRSTGPHLHFEIRLNGRALNPLNYI